MILVDEIKGNVVKPQNLAKMVNCNVKVYVPQMSRATTNCIEYLF